MPSGAAIVGMPRAGRRVGGVARGHRAARPEGPAGSHAVAALVAKPGLITRVAELARVAARAGRAWAWGITRVLPRARWRAAGKGSRPGAPSRPGVG